MPEGGTGATGSSVGRVSGCDHRAELAIAREQLNATVDAINTFYIDWNKGQSDRGDGVREDRRRRFGNMTLDRLFDLCFRPDQQPFKSDRFEKLLRKNKNQMPKTLSSIRETCDDLALGLARAIAEFDPARILHDSLSAHAGRDASASEGFARYIGQFHTWRLDAHDQLIPGQLEFFLHPTGLKPHFRHVHSREIEGNLHTFRYHGPVIMMPGNIDLTGFRVDANDAPIGEMRPCKLIRGEPSTRYILGDFVTQQVDYNVPFSRRLVLFRQDLWKREPKDDTFLRNLLQAPPPQNS